MSRICTEYRKNFVVLWWMNLWKPLLLSFQTPWGCTSAGGCEWHEGQWVKMYSSGRTIILPELFTTSIIFVSFSRLWCRVSLCCFFWSICSITDGVETEAHGAQLAEVTMCKSYNGWWAHPKWSEGRWMFIFYPISSLSTILIWNVLDTIKYYLAVVFDGEVILAISVFVKNWTWVWVSGTEWIVFTVFKHQMNLIIHPFILFYSDLLIYSQRTGDLRRRWRQM